MTNYLHDGYADTARVIRMMGFPSFGLDFDVGWGLIRTSPSKAVLECRARDHYFPMKVSAAERPPQWLGSGVHTIRISNATAWTPDIDRMTVVLALADSASCGK